MPRVTFTPQARADLRAIHTFISRDSPAAADRVIDRIIAAAERVCTFPLSGRTVPEYDVEDIREVIVYSYRVVYRIDPDEIQVLTIHHGARPMEDFG